MKLDLNSPHLPGPKPQLQGLVELFPGLFGIPDDEGRGRPDPEIYGLNEDLPKLLKVQVLVDELLLPLGTRVDAEKQGATAGLAHFHWTTAQKAIRPGAGPPFKVMFVMLNKIICELADIFWRS